MRLRLSILAGSILASSAAWAASPSDLGLSAHPKALQPVTEASPATSSTLEPAATLPPTLRSPNPEATVAPTPSSVKYPKTVVPSPSSPNPTASLPNPSATSVAGSPVASPLPSNAVTPASSPMTTPTPTPLAVSLQSEKIARRTLVNGLHVVVVEDHAAPVVQTGMWYRFGALDEVSGKTGLAHGLEHMMFRGTPSLSEGGFDDTMAHQGAQTNANTANDYTHYYLVLPASRVELAIRIEADRMRNLLLAKNDWRLEKGAVLNEYDGDLGNPTTKFFNDVCLRATPVPLCGLGALGVRSDIVRSSTDDLRSYYDAYYRPNNATLVVVGDITPAAVFRIAERAFQGIEPKALHRHAHRAPALTRHQRFTEHGDTPYVSLDLAYPSVGDLSPSAGAANVLDGLLSNPRGPLYEAMVVSGLALGYQSSLNSNLQGGIEHVIITVAPGHTQLQVEQAFRSTLRNMLRSGIAESLIAAAKQAALVNSISSRDAIDSLGDRVGYALAIEQRSPAYDDALIANTTVDQVNAFARRTLSEPYVVGSLLPRRPRPGSVKTTGASVADNFTGRTPSGQIVKAPWVKHFEKQKLTISSRIHPVEFTLHNGVHVLVQPVHGNPTVFIDGGIEGSPKLEPHGKEGLREMTSDLLGYGGERYDFEAQHTLSDQLGAGLNFGESFGAHGLARDLPRLLDLLADGELHPRFTPKYIALVRSQTLAEVEARDRDPDSLASRQLSLLLLPHGDPELRQATKHSLKTISDYDFYAYAKFAYRPDLATITVVGDVQPDDVKRELERTFGAWSADGPRPNLKSLSIPLPVAARKHVLASRRLVEVSLAQPSIARNSRDFIALNLLNAMLGGGGGFDTRLMRELRERRGLVYSASSGLEVGKYRGVLAINLSTESKHVNEAIALAKAQLHRFLETAPSQGELDRARERVVAGSLVAEQSTAVIASHVTVIGHFNLPSDYYRQLWRTYGKVTPQDILAVARRQLHIHNLVIVTEGPDLQ